MEGFSPNFLNLEYLFYKLYLFFKWVVSIFTKNRDFSIAEFIFKVILLVLITVICYTLVRIYEGNRKKEKKEKSLHDDAMIKSKPSEIHKNERWERIKTLMQSDKDTDWRIAIVEADTILDELIVRAGYKGENLGERLKSIEPSDFPYLNSAWEAHKVRNRIAHDGMNFELSRHTADEAIRNFEAVFRDLGFI
ncbi:hypothetical protein KC842_01610 [Candidatus Nomurabacteria bacterium]|nr:hypothetical protein [Candidatus Nomurabacteria bacterium]USN94485.1 MAG: hypothetical protein H6791_01840 [Candidatus Nomurabacteria bacterium]